MCAAKPTLRLERLLLIGFTKPKLPYYGMS